MPRVKAKKGQEQIHGFNFQKIIRALHGLDTVPNHNEAWDMEIGDCAYSIKTCGPGLPLSSVRAFYEIDRPFTMIVGWHKNYLIHTVAEFDVSLEMLNKIRGDVPLSYVEQLYSELSIKNWPEGTHFEARAWAQEQKKILDERFHCLLTWNPKIDSKRQRRWQCSLNATKVKNLFPEIEMNNPVYRGFDFSTISNIKLDQKHIDSLQEQFLNDQKISA